MNYLGDGSRSWGEGIEGRDRQTSWKYATHEEDTRAPHNYKYDPNPWDIVVNDSP